MDNLFTNVGAKLKAFAQGYFKITTVLLIVGGVISFFALILEEYTAPYAFGILFGVPLTILGNLVACWILHAFGSIAEKHEDYDPELKQTAPTVVVPNAAHPAAAPAPASTPAPKTKATFAPMIEHEEVSIKNGLCPDCNRPLEDSTIVGIKECPDCGRMFG